MAVSFTRLGNSLPFSRLFRYLHSTDDILDSHDLPSFYENSISDLNTAYLALVLVGWGLGQLEQEMETVIAVLQPGPLGIVEHKFSSEEMREANATVKRAVENWRRNANLEARVE
ncbi:hypothetical protein C3L33_04055, partial [Rhododendron williamsianum]